MKGKTIKFKLTAVILGVSLASLLILSAATLINIVVARNDILAASDELGRIASADSAAALEQETQQKLGTISDYMARLADEKLGRIARYTTMLADTASRIFSDPAAYPLREISGPLAENTDKLAVYFTHPAAVGPEALLPDARLAANCQEIMYEMNDIDPTVLTCYVSFNTGLHVVCDSSSASRLAPDYNYDPRTRSWFTNAQQNGKLSFSDVVDDAQGRGLGLVCSAPFYGADGEMLGAVGVGALLSDISELVLNTDFAESGQAFILNHQAQMIIGAGVSKDAAGNISRVDFAKSDEPQLQALSLKMVNGESGVAQVAYEGRDVYLAYSPIATADWILVTLIDVEEALRLSQLTAEKISALAAETSGQVDRSIVVTIVIILAVMAVTSLLVLLIGLRQSQKLTGPLSQLTLGVNEIAGGNLNYQLDIRTGDEIQTVASAFNAMTGELREYIDNLTRVTAEKERIGAELNVAATIQQSMLPCIFPAFPERDEFDIYATMLTAKEVGGDFYDFFLIDDTHLGLVMADVSGKGVPASLFMVIAKTLIKNHAQLGESAAEIFTNVNEQLCEGNEAGMFVTAWLGILDIGSGCLSYANAGHNPPIFRRGGGAYEYLHCRPGFVLAGMEGIKYRQAELMLAPGDRLYLYTDGVTEATNAAEELYGEARLLQVLNQSGSQPLTAVLGLIQADIDGFVGEAPQFDDITMLLLEYQGGGEQG